MGRALVLNASYEPLGVVTGRRAVVLVLAGKADPIHESGLALHSERVVVVVPSVIRLRYLVKVPYQRRINLSRRAVLHRDDSRCQYCGRDADSIDHVVPRSRGGAHAWDNVVAACRRCNHTKADRSLAELGWKLPHPPRTPSGAAWRLLGARTVDPRWREWLGVPETVSA